MIDLLSVVDQLFEIAHVYGLIDYFNVSDDEQEYKTKLNTLLLAAWSGRLTAKEFAKKHHRLLEVLGLAMLAAALLREGVSMDDLDAAIEDNAAYLNEWIDSQSQYLDQFATDVVEARGDMPSRIEIRRRVELWAASMSSMVNIAVVQRNPDELLTFTGSSGKESCKTCISLMGRAMPASWWIESDLVPGVPGNESYECGGWQCQHILINDAGVQRLP